MDLFCILFMKILKRQEFWLKRLSMEGQKLHRFQNEWINKQIHFPKMTESLKGFEWCEGKEDLFCCTI